MSFFVSAIARLWNVFTGAFLYRNYLLAKLTRHEGILNPVLSITLKSEITDGVGMRLRVIEKFLIISDIGYFLPPKVVFFYFIIYIYTIL
jgi:hypothetical protein